jgi:NitT/TauT family transport system substrate-binding protein
MRRFFENSPTLALLFAVTAVVASCAPAPPEQKYALRLGILATQSGLPYYVIQEKGLDRKYGVQLTATEYPGGEAIIDAMTAGRLDLGIGGSVSILAAAENGLVPDRIVPVAAINLVDPEHPFIGVLVSHSIKSWQDLKGKKIAVNAVISPNAAAIKGRLLLESVQDYDLVIMSFANMGLAVADDTIAAAAIVEPYLTQSLLRKDGKFLDWIVGGPPFETMQMTMLSFEAGLHRDHPQAVKAFLRAYLEAMQLITGNPGEARVIIGRRMNLANDVTQKMRLMDFSADGLNNPAALESMQPVLIKTGMLKAPIPVSRLYDETLLRQVLTERR